MSSVDVAKAKAKIGTTYAKGCSGYVCDLLGKDWKAADDFTQGESVGSNNNYSNLSPGDIVGFPGHVAIYIGE
jgi:cell wall-associated NlpC family hydrolase